MKKYILLLLTIVLLSGCSYKMELVSRADNVAYYGTVSQGVEDTFEIQIKDENFKGSFDIMESVGYGTDSKGKSFSTVYTNGAKIWQKGNRGGFLKCDFTYGNSVEYGTCYESRTKQNFDLRIK